MQSELEQKAENGKDETSKPPLGGDLPDPIKIPDQSWSGCPFRRSPYRSQTEDEIEGLNYNDYLGLDKLLTSQHPQSEICGKEAPDELLFIITHQVFELWFKMVIRDLDNVLHIFAGDVVPNVEMMAAVRKLQRIIKIMAVVVQQFDILETMTALDFLEFRPLLGTSSGFQSLQFRLIEIKLGLQDDDRVGYGNKPYSAALKKDQQVISKKASESLNLFMALEGWLERCPFLHIEYNEDKEEQVYDFWESYEKAVEFWMEEERTKISASTASEQLKEKRIKEHVDGTLTIFKNILDHETYEKNRKMGRVKFTHKAFKAAMMILLYRNQPIFQMPFQFLESVMEVDARLVSWRHRHALMVQRMIGVKMGTGGSSGFHYLACTATRHRVFRDLFGMSSYMIPKHCIPTLPNVIHQRTDFRSEDSEFWM